MSVQPRIGKGTSVQTGVYVPPGSVGSDSVFLGPHALLTNDPYPLRQDVELTGPTLHETGPVSPYETVSTIHPAGTGGHSIQGRHKDRSACRNATDPSPTCRKSRQTLPWVSCSLRVPTWAARVVVNT